MPDPTDNPTGVTTARTFTPDDLAYLNRMTTTGLVLPSVAHEINNSLQVISGMVEILGLRGQLAPEVADKVEKIAAQANKAAANLRDLVAFSRRDGVARKIDARTAVEHAVALRRYYLSRGKVTVTVEVAEGERLVAAIDSQHLVQVLANLVINAEEAVAQGERREVAIRLSRQGDRVVCAVLDSGPGFPGDPAISVGQAFSTTKVGGAAGLGLAVARQLVEQAGGSLSIQAGPPACVTVALPSA